MLSREYTISPTDLSSTRSVNIHVLLKDLAKCCTEFIQRIDELTTILEETTWPPPPSDSPQAMMAWASTVWHTIQQHEQDAPQKPVSTPEQEEPINDPLAFDRPMRAQKLYEQSRARITLPQLYRR